MTGPVEELDPAELIAPATAFTRLVEAVYGEAPGVGARRWRYVGPGPARALGIRRGAHLAACLVLQVCDLSVDGARRPGWRMIDVMTHPEARRRGHLAVLARRALALAREEDRAVLGFPNERSVRGFLGAGWATLGPVPAWSSGRPEARPDAGAPAARRATREGAQRGPGDGAARAHLEGGWRPAGAHLPAVLESVWAAQRAVGVHRDLAYWRWRLARPDATYAVFVADPGLLVLKAYGADVVNDAELLVAPGALAVAAAGLRAARAWAEARGARELTAWLAPGSALTPAYRGAGLRPAPSGRVILLEPEALGARPWHLAQLDSDVY
ncbi:MAG: GNAT family N-acetyltransferase [Sandaracinaceae bacterium]